MAAPTPMLITLCETSSRRTNSIVKQSKADRIRKQRKKKPQGCKAVLEDIQERTSVSSGEAEFITFKFRLENGQLVYRNAPPLLASRSVTWKMISGILGADLGLDYRQWIKARSLKDLIGRKVLVAIAQKVNRNGNAYTHVEEVFPA